MRALVAILIALAGLSSASLADPYVKVEKCVAIPNDVERLSCYDAAAAEAGLRGAGQSAIVLDVGNWEVQESINPIDDSKTVTLVLEAYVSASTRGVPVSLVARCQSNTTNLYIEWNDWLVFNTRTTIPVVTRIGDEPAVVGEWTVSADDQATLAPGWAGDWLRMMVQSNRFVAQVTPSDLNPSVAQFDTTGLATALVPLMDACGWGMD